MLAGIIADHVLIEIAYGACVRRSGQANDKSVKIFQHLTPHVVYRAVAFVHDDTIKKLRRHLRVVYDLFVRLAVGTGLLKHGFLLGGFIQFLAFKDGIHALDRADINLHIRQPGRLQATDRVDFGKGAGIVVWVIGPKLTFCLFTEVFGVHKEQDPLHTAEF